MKKCIILLLFTFSFFDLSAKDDILLQKSKEYVNLIVNENFVGISTYYDSTMAEMFPPIKVKEFWTQIKEQYGKPVTVGNPKLHSLSGHKAVYIPLHFNSISLEARVIFNDSRQISGFFITPLQNDAHYKHPDYADTSRFVERDVKFGSEYWQLEGTLTIPTGIENPPLIILVHGSGAHNRNEQIGPNRPFQDLAWGLASNGIAVFRYDKRNLAQATKFLENLDTMTIYHESVEDAILAAEEIAGIKEFSKSDIYLIGHSQGGYVIPIINRKTDIFKGYISLAGLADDFRETLKRQYQYLFMLDGKYDEGERQAYEALKQKISKLDSLLINDYHREELPLSLTPAYWQYILDYDIKSDIRKIDKPILVINGGKDYQVVKNDFEIWQNNLSSNKNAEFVWYDELNHLFMFKDNEKSNPQDYFEPNNIAENVIIDIAKWIKSNN